MGTHDRPDRTNGAPSDGEEQLTAYALGELEGAEQAAVEARLARDPAARRFVEETRAAAQLLQRELHAELADAARQSGAAARKPASAARIGAATASPRESRRASEDWKRYRQRHRVFAFVKLLLFVAVLGALVGLGIRFREQIMALIKPPEVAQTPPPPKAIVPPPEPKRSVVPAPPDAAKNIAPEPVIPRPEPSRPVPAAPEPVEAEEKRAKELLAQGQQEMGKLDFAGAKKIFDDAALLKAGPETHRDATRWQHKADQFHLGTKHIEVSKFATAPTSVRIVLRSGAEMRGLLDPDADTEDTLALRRVSDENPAATGIQRVQLPKVEIFQKTEVPLAERQQEFQSLVAQLESNSEVGPGCRASDYYDLVFLSKRLGLAAKCLEYLNQAYVKVPQGMLANVFRNLIIARALERANLLAVAGRKVQAEGVLNELLKYTLPDYEPAKDAVDAFRLDVLAKIKDDFKSTIALVKPATPAPTQGTTATAAAKPSKTAAQLVSQASSDQGGGTDVQIVVDDSGVSSRNPKAAALIAQANRFYSEGMATYAQYRQGTKGSNNAILQKAESLLEKAVDLYGQALDLDKRNRAIEDRQVEANLIVYACKKYQTL